MAWEVLSERLLFRGIKADEEHEGREDDDDGEHGLRRRCVFPGVDKKSSCRGAREERWLLRK
jgi:hypothetical protein